MRPLHIIHQTAITRNHDVASALARLAINTHTRIDAANWKAQIDAAEADPALSRTRPLVFCSLQIATYVARCCPNLARGLILPRAFLDHHAYSSLLPRDIRLNPRGIYLPWGDIPDAEDLLRNLCPDGIFIRPNSPMKPFTGFSVAWPEIGREHAAMTRAAHISASELCWICAVKDVAKTEYRIWIVDGQVATSASYGWDEESEQVGTAPDDILAAAARVAQCLEMVEQIYTADFVQTPQGARLVELNAMSTSGWYRHMDPTALLQALDPMLF